MAKEFINGLPIDDIKDKEDVIKLIVSVITNSKDKSDTINKRKKSGQNYKKRRFSFERSIDELFAKIPNSNMLGNVPLAIKVDIVELNALLANIKSVENTIQWLLDNVTAEKEYINYAIGTNQQLKSYYDLYSAITRKLEAFGIRCIIYKNEVVNFRILS
jgi:hypothetical protein